MKSIPDFLEYLSKHTLKKNYSFQSNFNTNGVRSFFVLKGKKKFKYTTLFNRTCLEDCQLTIFETNDSYIPPLELSKKLITKLDDKLLTEEGLKLKQLLKEF